MRYRAQLPNGQDVSVRIREPEGVKSASRVLAILDLLTASERPLTYTELLSITRYPRSSLHILLRTMLGAGWLELSGDHAKYVLGIRCWEAGHSYRRALSLAARCRPAMERVRDALNETVQLAVLDGRYNVYVEKVDGNQRLQLDSEVGRRLPAHATGVGKVLLSGLRRDQFDQLFDGVALESFTPQTIPSVRSLSAELERIRIMGYGVDNEEYTPGVRCVAVPIYDHTERIVAAMSLSVPATRFKVETQRRAVTLLITEASKLSHALGYRPTGTRSSEGSNDNRTPSSDLM